MAIKYDNVIVFGPTGVIGGVAALEASKRGAKVWLAMRDPSKAIPAITKEQEQAGNFERIKADLSDPESVKQAVEKSGAKSAYVYIIHGGSLDGAFKAMKAAGIEHVVLLSSFTIPEDKNLREITPDMLIPFIHAKEEASLEDNGIAHTALRPGSFAYNTFQMSTDKSKTPYQLCAYSDGSRPMDNIVPEDIGRVGGAVLVDRPSTSSKEIIYLYGPKMSTEMESMKIIKNTFPDKVEIVSQDSDEWCARLSTVGVPPPLIDYFRKVLAKKGMSMGSDENIKQGQANVKKYSGYEPTTFEEYVKTQKYI